MVNVAKAVALPEATPIGKLSDKTIATTLKWALHQFKTILGAVPTKENRAELERHLREHDMADVLQTPIIWYIRGTNERAYIYGNRIMLSGKNSLEPFAEIGFDSTGIIKPTAYDLESMAEEIFPGSKELKPCGWGLRVEIKTPNQAGNLATFPHLLHRNLPYDEPLKNEIRRRSQDIIKRCSDSGTSAEAIRQLAIKLNDLCPSESHPEQNIGLIRPSRQPSSTEATHFKLKYTYQMLTHSGRIVETFHEFRVNIRNQGFDFVMEDLASYAKARKAEGVRRQAYKKFESGLRLSRLAANVLDIMTDQQKESLFGGGTITFMRDKISYTLTAKKLEIETTVRFEGANVSDKGAQLTIIVPDSVCASLVGESLRKVIDHPLITDDMIITKYAMVLGSPVFTYKAPTILFKE